MPAALLNAHGLREITLADKPVFDRCFRQCPAPLSDYTFANTFIWREPIHLRWRISRDCLCVFANGDGGLTLLFPPLGQGDSADALRESLDLCQAYNVAARYDPPTRVEYVSAGLLRRFPPNYCAHPMSGDYVYATRRMIELDGSDLASKRKARNRFARLCQAHTEPLQPRHVAACLELLKTWHAQAEASPPAAQDATVRLKRAKEETATRTALLHAVPLGLTGMVLYAGDQFAGFTLGEMLDAETCSILIEKTDRRFKGAAQYIFSEFCRQYWAHTQWCNVGDDWEIPSLAWTKESYRPSARREKWTLQPTATPIGLRCFTRVPASTENDMSLVH
jgi:hypothetical protein